MSTPKFSAEHVCTALHESRGLVSIAARKLGCSRQTVYTYVDRYASCREAMKDERERFLDNVELRLIEAAEVKAEPWAITYSLSRLGKERGYVEKVQTEHSGPGGGAINVRDVSRLSDDELRAITSRAARRSQSPPGAEPPAS